MTVSVNEKSPIFITIVFTDELGDPLIPQTVDWRLDDRTNDIEIQPWTPLASPASTMSFTIAGDKNVITDEEHVKEVQIFGVRVDDGLAGEGHAEVIYNVLNLTGPTGP